MIFIASPFVFGMVSHNLSAWGTSSTSIVSISDKAYGSTSTLVNALLANAPQFLLSVCYLIVNGLCTGMASAYEWNNLAISRKGLRVTTPKGQQRSTYFLQLPSRWALPLLIASAILHWLMSQSFFLVRVDKIDAQGDVKDWTSACGFSGLSFLIACLVFLGLVTTVAGVSLIRFPLRMPFAASCSLVISAACHPLREENCPHLEPIKWGVVTGSATKGMVRHCSFSTKSVKRPKEGLEYQ